MVNIQVRQANIHSTWSMAHHSVPLSDKQVFSEPHVKWVPDVFREDSGSGGIQARI
jgi:hypothetical protein